MPLRREAFLERVKERGEYATEHEAERAARVVLALLGAHLVGEVRAQLAARLPEDFALILLNPLQSSEPLTPERFVRATAAWIEGATERTAAWDVSAVLSTVADAADPDLTGPDPAPAPDRLRPALRPPSAHLTRIRFHTRRAPDATETRANAPGPQTAARVPGAALRAFGVRATVWRTRSALGEFADGVATDGTVVEKGCLSSVRVLGERGRHPRVRLRVLRGRVRLDAGLGPGRGSGAGDAAGRGEDGQPRGTGAAGARGNDGQHAHLPGVRRVGEAAGGPQSPRRRRRRAVGPAASRRTST